MTDPAKPDEPKPDDKPQFLTKADVEAMLTSQQAHFEGMFTAGLTRLAETLTSKPSASTGGNEGERGKVVSFYEKPEEAANALFDAKMAPMRDAYVAGEKARQIAEVAALPHAGEYLDEVKKVIESAPPLAQIQPGFAREAYNLVIGRHRDEVFAKMKEAEAKKKSAEPEFTETVSAGAPPSRKSETLSATEREAANGMGLTDDEYKKWRDDPDAMAKAAMTPQKKAS